ncbi:MAG TPA: hypothetical protein VHO49_08995, partial [Anaerolineales bacterium]|nr:hypothetical protein [Anaerolineales bacterium]
MIGDSGIVESAVAGCEEDPILRRQTNKKPGFFALPPIGPSLSLCLFVRKRTGSWLLLLFDGACMGGAIEAIQRGGMNLKKYSTFSRYWTHSIKSPFNTDRSLSRQHQTCTHYRRNSTECRQGKHYNGPPTILENKNRVFQRGFREVNTTVTYRVLHDYL